MKILNRLSTFIGFAFLFSGAAYGATIHVPGDQPAIQAGIDAASDGDSILVAPGSYENFNFNGKNLTVRSDVDGDPATYDILPHATITGDCHFNNGETEEAVLDGFTVGYVDIGCCDLPNPPSPTIKNCIQMRRSCSDGCGLQVHANSYATIINSMFFGNNGGEGAGVKVGPYTSAKFINCMFFGNSATYGGGLSCNDFSSATLINSIFWGNKASYGHEIAVLNNSTVTVSYSDIQGGRSEVFVDGTSTLNWDSGTNINADPFFVDVSGENFHVQLGSPCIDVATASEPNLPGTDYEGDLRIMGIAPDMGADEYQFDFMEPLNPGDIELTGYVGSKIEISEENRLKQVDYEELVRPFHDRDETDWRWRCEFWGKITRSAVTSFRYSQDENLKNILDETVNDLLSAQTADGCISSYPYSMQASDGWDIWGRKYVFLGLARYYQYISESEPVKQAMIDAADYLMTQVGPGLKNILETGEHEGMASSSILEPLIILYKITKNSKYLNYAQWIADQGGSTRHDIFGEARSGRPPKEIGNGKAYEMMSCFEGLAELYRVTVNADYHDSLMALYENIRDQEIMIHGLGGLKDDFGEYWYDGALNQTRIDKGRKGETCVTVTWFKFCSHILRLTGDSKVADQMEITMYNALIGAMRPSGEWWTHQNPTLVTGDAYNYKKDAHLQFPDFNQNCCLANGPMALAMIPQYAVMKTTSGPIINFYAQGTAMMDVGGNPITLNVSGDYPKTGSISIVVTPPASLDFTISLRIPEWSAATHTTLRVNGGANIPVTSGTYEEISRTWHPGDVIDLTLDMRGRYITPLGASPYGAIMRGPVVLAQDSRISDVGSNVTVTTDANGYVDLIPTIPGNPDIWMVFELPSDGSRLCDYASAGNEFDPANRLCVWFPTTVLTGPQTIRCASDEWYTRAEDNGDENGDDIRRSPVIDDLAKWELIPDGIYYRIQLSGTEFYLSGEEPEGSIPNGRNVHLWTWADSDLQRWEMISDGSFVRLRCVEDDVYLSGSGEDDNIHLWGWVGSDLQRWEIQDFTPEACEGDFDGNGVVNEIDLSTFAVDFGRSNCIDVADCPGDFNTDNDVDGKNLSTFIADFGRTDCP